MKLYATLTSEKSSKGVGSQNLIEIDLKTGNKRVGRLRFSVNDRDLDDQKPYLEILNTYGTWNHIPLRQK